MRVEHRVDVGAGAVDFGMDVELERRLGGALDEVAVEVDADDVLDASARRARTRPS